MVCTSYCTAQVGTRTSAVLGSQCSIRHLKHQPPYLPSTRAFGDAAPRRELAVSLFLAASGSFSLLSDEQTHLTRRDRQARLLDADSTGVQCPHLRNTARRIVASPWRPTAVEGARNLVMPTFHTQIIGSGECPYPEDANSRRNMTTWPVLVATL